MSDELPTGCLVPIGVVLICAAVFFTIAEVARGVVWIKWMLS